MTEDQANSFSLDHCTIDSISNTKMSINDFQILKVVGKGAYGKVLLVRKSDNQHIYAMKIIKKAMAKKKSQYEHIQSERKILEMMNHPFIISLKYAFQSEEKLYFVMNYCPGGELFYHIQTVERFNEEAAKFYAAQMVLAIEYLHKFNIIYRDLKPENVLISKDGYIQLTDFGLSKQNISDNKSANTFCGTPEYLAPEVIEKIGHGKSVDWWSLGAIVYEMLTGAPPFYSENYKSLFTSIVIGKVKYPHYLSKEARLFFDNVFIRDPDKRLGSKNGADDIKAHPFFKGVNWEDIFNKKIKPPFLPRLAYDHDTKYFGLEFTSDAPEDSICTPKSHESDNNIENYKGFSYNGDLPISNVLE